MVPTPSLGAVTKGVTLGRQLVWESEALFSAQAPSYKASALGCFPACGFQTRKASRGLEKESYEEPAEGTGVVYSGEEEAKGRP